MGVGYMIVTVKIYVCKRIYVNICMSVYLPPMFVGSREVLNFS